MGAARWFQAASTFGFVRNTLRMLVTAFAGETVGMVQAAVRSQRIAAAGPFVQVVDVLGDEGQFGKLGGQFGDGVMGGVGLSKQHLLRRHS